VRIRATKKVKYLLLELDGAFRRFDELVGTLANRETEISVAIETGAVKQAQERIILGIAYRINKASRGEEVA
jgi:hypothetical protein